ncbi:unnamed protein product [Calypogeia fissa]
MISVLMPFYTIHTLSAQQNDLRQTTIRETVRTNLRHVSFASSKSFKTLGTCAQPTSLFPLPCHSQLRPLDVLFLSCSLVVASLILSHRFWVRRESKDSQLLSKGDFGCHRN